MALTLNRGESLNRNNREDVHKGFRMPNPGDVFMMVAFGWAAVCFLLVVGGPAIARRLAILSASSTLRDTLLTEQSAVGLLMIVGMVGLAVSFYLVTRYRVATIAVLFFSMTFSNASWPPIHDIAFATKYLILIYLGAYSVIFFLRNGWRLAGADGYRLVMMYLAWLALVVAANGFRLPDMWYLATEFTLMIGFGIAWLSKIDNREELESFNNLLAYVAIAITLGNLLAIAVVPSYTMGGRFVGMSGRATGFATIFAIFVLAMFWMSMYEKNVFKQRLFNLFAFIGFGMILWSGTRNATVATMIGIVALWWVIRSKVLVYIVGAGFIGLIMQIILTGSEDVSMLSDRLASTENTRLGAWELYVGLALKSPIWGYGYDGLVRAVYGERLVGIVSSFGRLTVPGVHNLYIGFAVRWGLVGLFFQLLLFYAPARIAWKVIFSRNVSQQDKQVYILPVAVLLVIALEGLFEDTMGSTGRGTVHGMIYGMGIPLVYLYGKRLLVGSADTAESGAEALPASKTRARVLHLRGQ